MNKKRRSSIKFIIEQLQSISEQIEEIKDQEEFALENLPEQFAYGKAGDKMNDGIDNLDSSICSIEDSLSFLEQSIS